MIGYMKLSKSSNNIAWCPDSSISNSYGSTSIRTMAIYYFNDIIL